MDNFVNLLEEYKVNVEDEQTITKFKEKLNEQVEYKLHLAKYEFTKEWFSILDYILTQLGYRALDADIKYIMEEVKELLLETNINIFIDTYNQRNLDKIKKIKDDLFINYQFHYSIEIVEYLIKNPHLIGIDFSKNPSNLAIDYLMNHQDKISWDKFSFNSNDIAVNYLIEKHPDKIDWWYFSQNESDIAVGYLLKHPDKINHIAFLNNKNLTAIEYFIKNINLYDIPEYYETSRPLRYTKHEIYECIDKVKDKDDFIKSIIKNIDKVNNTNFMVIMIVMRNWKINVFNSLNWLPMSNIIINT